MSGQNNAMKIRPRFSVRTLAIFVTLVCAYFGVWEVTKRLAIPDPTVEIQPANGVYIIKQPTEGKLIHTKDSGVAAVITASSPAPFVIRTHELVVEEKVGRVKQITRFYLWLLGPTIKLPIEWDGE